MLTRDIILEFIMPLFVIFIIIMLVYITYKGRGPVYNYVLGKEGIIILYNLQDLFIKIADIRLYNIPYYNIEDIVKVSYDSMLFYQALWFNRYPLRPQAYVLIKLKKKFLVYKAILINPDNANEFIENVKIETNCG